MPPGLRRGPCGAGILHAHSSCIRLRTVLLAQRRMRTRALPRDPLVFAALPLSPSATRAADPFFRDAAVGNEPVGLFPAATPVCEGWRGAARNPSTPLRPSLGRHLGNLPMRSARQHGTAGDDRGREAGRGARRRDPRLAHPRCVPHALERGDRPRVELRACARLGQAPGRAWQRARREAAARNGDVAWRESVSPACRHLARLSRQPSGGIFSCIFDAIPAHKGNEVRR